MKPLRLLLVEPPFYRLYSQSYGLCKLPLGLAGLAVAALGVSGVEVAVCNADFHPSPAPFSATFLAGKGYATFRQALETAGHPAFDATERLAREYAPDLIGMTVRTPALTPALLTAQRLRRAAPSALLLAGGPHASIAGADLLRVGIFDAVVPGEGEATLVDLLQTLGRGGQLAEVPGLLLRADGRARRTAPRPLLDDLDALPFPASLPSAALIDGADYPDRAFGYVFGARGCPHRCAYCSSRGVWGRRVRFRSDGNILAELEALAQRGLGHVHFDDDTFGVTPQRLRSLCRAIEQARLGVTLSCETHVTLVDETSAEAMARAGFVTVQLGVESGDDAMLARIGKGFRVARAERAAALIRQAGMRLEAFFMVGFPEETEATLQATRALMERLPCDKLIYSIFTPYPGTPLYAQCRSLGLIGPDYDPSRHNHQSPENAFCPRIPAQRFRAIAADIEAYVSEKNAAARATQEAASRQRSSAIRSPTA